VSDLLDRAKKSEGGAQKNCSIALARLASGHSSHLAKLKALDGMKVLLTLNQTLE
jgi:hypothetical protein